jgi:hypothetical protein
MGYEAFRAIRSAAPAPPPRRSSVSSFRRILDENAAGDRQLCLWARAALPID